MGSFHARVSCSLVSDAFFIQESEERFVSTGWTTGPWNRESQHAGPPSALLGRAIERTVGRDDLQVARITLEILRPVPIAPLQVSAKVLRPGRSVVLSSAAISDDKGTVMSATAWSIRVADTELERVVHGRHPPKGPADSEEVELFPTQEPSYLTAMEWRFAAGGFLVPGPAAAWARMRIPLVDGEEIAPLSRVLALADSGNGISAALDFGKWLFVNPDLSVYLHRLPRGEWVCLDAATTIEPSGIGVAASVLSDEEGVIGRGAQSLFVAPRD